MVRRNNTTFGGSRRSGRPYYRNADRLAYDALSRLTAAYSNGTLVVSNRYDHIGRRVQKIAADGTHTILYDGWLAARGAVDNGECRSV